MKRIFEIEFPDSHGRIGINEVNLKMMMTTKSLIPSSVKITIRDITEDKGKDGWIGPGGRPDGCPAT
jgi:hypothetical protein